MYLWLYSHMNVLIDVQKYITESITWTTALVGGADAVKFRRTLSIVTVQVVVRTHPDM